MRTARSTSLLLALLAATTLLAPARAGAAPPSPGSAVAPSPAAVVLPARSAAVELGPLQLRWLPAGLGAPWRGEPYEFDDVTLTSVVWESRRPGGDDSGWRVDAHVTVMTADRFTTARAVHDWVIGYQQRPADEVRYRPVRVHGRPGWLTRDQVFWWSRPGLVVSVTLDPQRWTTSQVLRVARTAVVRAGDGDAAGRR